MEAIGAGRSVTANQATRPKNVYNNTNNHNN